MTPVIWASFYLNLAYESLRLGQNSGDTFMGFFSRVFEAAAISSAMSIQELHQHLGVSFRLFEEGRMGAVWKNN